MQSLPPWVTAGGTFLLPLSEATAARLAAAWICSAHDQRRTQLRAAWGGDSALALWAVLHVDVADQKVPPPLEELTALLDEKLRSQFTGHSAVETALRPHLGSETSGQLYGEIAGHSLVVAHVARTLATAAGLDGEWCYLLGLLHRAPGWLKAAAANPAAVGRATLPEWLAAELAQIVGTPTRPPLSAASCVSLAITLASSQDEALFAQHGLDPRPWIGKASRWAKAWSASGPWAGSLPVLAQRLARLELLETEFAGTLETEKLESLKELAYGAGHEINNPLANISARAQTLLPGEHDPDRRRLLAAINTQAFRAHEMIADMMLFARPPAPQLAEVELNGLLEKLLAELADQAAAQQTELALEIATQSRCVTADATQLAVAIRAVCVNALEALVHGGRVEIALGESAESPAMTQILIEDTGPGIPENVRRHLFDPFYSGREAGRGLGFGLSKCWRIVTLHGGRVDVEPRPGGGTRFRIVLPNCNNR
jgi:signal transduction histidine kinase